jgi:hypothetical protein
MTMQTVRMWVCLQETDTMDTMRHKGRTTRTGGQKKIISMEFFSSAGKKNAQQTCETGERPFSSLLFGD